ncbi:major facilitator superfamily domain-containing protein [Ephemerocybe angulata]|uniref:Major facilitator superfamily domain-containing protein n=1 Tax=Ephemerocybe angulata TaxID=980116 RepID=A0A8H6II44_9AGAR|nr:major facilitator superfamily domain-containing protein [Tulosesus angulatus]
MSDEKQPQPSHSEAPLQGANDGSASLDSEEHKRSVTADVKVEEETTPSSGARTPNGRTRKQLIASNIQFGALCFCMIVVGWNDGSTGPLIPRIRKVYDVRANGPPYVFVVSCVGFILGALANVWLTDKLGFGKVMVLGAALQVITFSVQSAAPPFPAFVVVNLVNGFGFALQDSQANGFVGSLSHYQQTKMGILHAAYAGVGAFAAPLVSTKFAQMDRWSFHYLTSLGIAVINTIALAVVFRFKEHECLAAGGEDVHVSTAAQEKGKFGQIMKNRSVHLFAFFILFYVGVEVTIGGWMVTFIIDERHGGPSSGYVSSGFFGGLTLGRVILIPVNKWVGERNIFFIYAGLAFGLDFVIWFVPSLVGNAGPCVTVSIIGMLLGPMYPIALNQASRILPPWLLTASIGWIAGFGQAGSAIIPFIAGAISEKHGIKSLHPMLVAMMGTMIVLFALTPDHPPPELAQSSTLESEGADVKEKVTP